MIKKIVMMGIAMMTIAISSCTEDTQTLGTSLISSADQFVITTDTLPVYTCSVVVDSILARSSYSYLGRIKDPETGSYIKADFMSQFSVLEDEEYNTFPEESEIFNVKMQEEKRAIADSCFINIIINNFMGDSLSPMKLQVCELAEPLKENRQYYSNYDIEKVPGILRTDGIRKSKVFSLSDLTQSDSIRGLNQSGANYFRIRIPLNDPYTDKNGNKYNNYGTYLMRTYYDHPEYFKNSQTFIQEVCPGFYFKMTDGIGMMSEVAMTQLAVHFCYVSGEKIISRSKVYNGNEEVLQTTHFTTDKTHLEELLKRTDCTYIKAPDGMFTEVTLPIADIKRNHENDTITSAKIVFRRMNDTSELSDDLLSEPRDLMIVESDSLFSFFEKRNLPNNIATYLATYDKSKNTYTFNNISGLINQMYSKRNKSADWNKAILVPVQKVTTTTNNTTTVASVSNELKVVSVRLVGGEHNQHEPVRISIVYNQTE